MSTRWPVKKYITKALKIIGWFLLSVIVVLVALALAIQIPYVQNKLTQKAVGFLKNKIGTEVRLDHISLSFPKLLVLEGLYLEDQASDTLLYIGELGVNTNLWSLTKNHVELSSISLSGLHANVKRAPHDSAFNFTYIINAFADTTAATPPDTTATPWTFGVGDVDINDAHIVFKDNLGGTDIKARIGTLDVDVESFDLEGPTLAIHSVNLEESSATVVMANTGTNTTPATLQPEPQEGEKGFTFTIQTVALKTIAADYTDKTSGMRLRANLGELEVEADTFNLDERVIALSEFRLTNTFLAYHQEKVAKASAKDAREPIDTTAAAPWRFSLASLSLENNNLQYYDFNFPWQQNAFDPHHLWVTRLQGEGKNLRYDATTIQGQIENFSFHEKNGFAVTDFHTRFAMAEKSAVVEDFYFQSEGTKVALQAAAKFTSFANIGQTYPDATIDLNLKGATVSLADVLYFSPHLLDSLPLTLPPATTVHLQAVANGRVKNLNIRTLRVSLLQQTVLRAHGTIAGLPNMETATMNLALDELYTTKADIETATPDTLLPTGLNLPGWLRLTGTFAGTTQTPKAKVLLTTDIGKVALNANLNLKPSPRERYDGHAVVTDLNLGHLLKQDSTLGMLNMEAHVKGSGFTLDYLNTLVDVNVRNIEYNHYTYRDFVVKGTLKKYFFSGLATLQDPNLNFKLEGDLDYDADVPEYNFTFNLKNADFKALHLSERPLRARGTLDVNLATADFKVINGNLDIRNVAIFNGESLYAVDSLLFASIDQKGQSEISIRSDILSGDFKGTINLYSLPEVLRRHVNQYFSLHDTVYQKPAAPQDFEFNLVIKNTDLITEILVPELEPFVPGEIMGSFDSEANNLTLRVNLTKLKYASVGVDSIWLDVSSDKRALDYTLAVRKLLVDTLRVEALRLAGQIAHDSIYTKFTLLDSAQRDKYIFGGVFHSLEKVFQFNFLPGQVVMNYAPWEAPHDNALQFTSNGVNARNFSITNINEKITFTTPEHHAAIAFKDVNLQNLTHVVEGTIPADGLLNGHVTLGAAGALATDLTVKALEIFRQPWGDLALTVDHPATQPYAINLTVKGEHNDIKAKGTYATDPTPGAIDFTTSLSVNLAAIEPLTVGQLKNSSGNVNGDITIRGTPAKPEIRGELAFSDASFVPSFVNSKFTLKDEHLAFTDEGITFKNFTVLDERGNKATVKGAIRTTDYSTFRLSMELNATDFQVLNTTEDDSELFYGKVGINMQARVRGTFDHPTVQTNVSLTEGSTFTYIVPQSEKGVMESKGIVVFKSKKLANDPFLKSIDPKDTVKSKFTGLDLTANIELNDNETFNIIIDPIAGDKLSVQGNSTLTLTMNQTGDMTLTGRYEITKGSYDMSFYKIVKRNFSIEKGSSMTWSGNPLDAMMDVRALYQVETSPAELMAATSAESAARYRQRLPFLVFLLIKGNLLTPEISFLLDMPENKQNADGGAIYAKIKDVNTRESDLNKQVFALLVLKRFIADNPLQSESGSDVASTARRSVSKLLTEQLNRLSENIKGVQLTFDVKSYEDYSTGEAKGQTDLQLGVSKSLFDDRLIVKVSGNVNLEGETDSQSSFADYIGDLALEYKLTEDGRFRITGFRNSNYDMIDGDLIETGAGLIYIKDYDTLVELFKANAKEK